MVMSYEQILQRDANESSNYWASMRNNLKMIYRSERISESTADALLSELDDILDSGILTYPNTLKELGTSPTDSLEERKAQFGLHTKPYEHNGDEILFLNHMANKADTVRKSNWTWRIGTEAEEKQALGWHPFFVTLTVDPSKHNPEQLWKEGREWRKYVRKLANIVCAELGHPPSHNAPYRPESDYVTYAGVLEHGKSREHHHAHFIIWMRTIPSSWRLCPNRGIPHPLRRTENECKQMSVLWPNSLPGLSPAKYFRTQGDIWSTKYNFALPVDKSGKPQRIGNARIAGGYITKYLTKEHKQWHHRMKCTRNLGMKSLKEWIANRTPETILALTWRPPKSIMNLSLLKTHSVPLGLVRSLAKQRLFLVKFSMRQQDLTELLMGNSEIFMKMLQSVRNGARPDRMDSNQFYDWLSQFHPVPKEYCEERLLKAHKLLSKIYPRATRRVKHTKIGANQIGYS